MHLATNLSDTIGREIYHQNNKLIGKNYLPLVQHQMAKKNQELKRKRDAQPKLIVRFFNFSRS